MKKEVFFIRFAKTGRLRDTMRRGEGGQQKFKKSKKLRDGPMPVEEMISITLNR